MHVTIWKENKSAGIFKKNIIEITKYMCCVALLGEYNLECTLKLSNIKEIKHYQIFTILFSYIFIYTVHSASPGSIHS